MDERLDAILSEYEEIWRGCAISNRSHEAFLTCGGTPRHIEGPMTADGTCAWLAAPKKLEDFARRSRLPWVCPLAGCTFKASGPEGLVLAMIHVNNAHHWTWDMFAGKFRDALDAGMVKGPDHA